ncbi:MAG TPA: M1 family aminopeptidase, partial [Chitinophagaceae bacterium]|nr:M1 family aminopeptidase [Chitinophagaceae bacterium]
AGQIGYGYEESGTKVVRPSGNKLTWKFIAPNVHDFMWAADPEFKHMTRKVKKDLTLHLLYKASNPSAATWEKILDDAEKALPFIEKTFGSYTYRQYSFVHGGDGGMEYPMATLLASPGAWLHEWLHNWYHGILATNESLYAWMDEGFTSYAEDRVKAFLENTRDTFDQSGNYAGYLSLVKSGKEEPLTTHADHFNTNAAYSAAAYTKGAVFLEQLGYITGSAVRDKILLAYYRQWKFKHPNAADFVRVAEKVSDVKLDWYKEYWVNSIKTIDYAFDSLWEESGKTRIRLKKIGLMPMPVDLQLTFKDGSSEMHYVPLDLMYGTKPAENSVSRKVYPAWKWTNETYIIESDRRLGDISIAEIDPSQRMADVERKNNRIKL